MNKHRIFLTLAGLIASTTVTAQDREHPRRFYVSPIVNTFQADDDRQVDDDLGFTLASGFELHPDWNLELNLSRARFDGLNGDDLTLNTAGIDALRVFRRGRGFEPYLLAGIGSQRKDRELGGDTSDFYGDLGVGFLTPLRRSVDNGRVLSLRVELRARHDDADGGSRLDYLLGAGLQFAFGRKAAALPPARPETPVLPPDTDGDGVPDNLDRCENTPPGVRVDGSGCERDGDSDGVVDRRDACPDTEAGARIDARGCEIKAEIRLPSVTFETNSATLEPTSFAVLDEAAETLRMNPDLRIEVAGHTDSRGTEDHNLALSQQRAETVLRYLSDRGVDNELTARGYGESRPIADNAASDGRARNRRVTLRIIGE